MYIKGICLFLLLSFFEISGQTLTQEKTVSFNEAALLQNLKTLSSDLYEGRRTSTQGAVRAKKFIINEFSKLDVLPINKSYEQHFSFINHRKQYNGTNVLGLIKGTTLVNEYIVISAHYDHEGIKNGEIFNGADDNASGISALFAFAEYFKKYPPKHSVILAAFDGEELDLQGSKYFVNHTVVPLKQIKANLNLDMISRSDKNELFAVGASINKLFKHVIENVKQSEKIKIILGHDGYDGLENWVYASDHANFYKKGIPFLYFGVEDHKDYHEPTDDYENIHPKFYIEAVKGIISIFEKIDTSKI
ncbi:M28 family peptidase [Thalassobellus citreus]|uniref:M28 family peptidase n=1 Tax=Thalassobellus citreus TaxID=3367752 RepID=UPI0037A1C51C